MQWILQGAILKLGYQVPIQGKTMAQSNEAGVVLLVEEGWKRSNELHRFLLDNPVSPMTTWPNKLLFLALISYATQLAKFTEIDRDGYLSLCAAFYDNIMVTTSPDDRLEKL